MGEQHCFDLSLNGAAIRIHTVLEQLLCCGRVHCEQKMHWDFYCDCEQVTPMDFGWRFGLDCGWQLEIRCGCEMLIGCHDDSRNDSLNDFCFSFPAMDLETDMWPPESYADCECSETECREIRNDCAPPPRTPLSRLPMLIHRWSQKQLSGLRRLCRSPVTCRDHQLEMLDYPHWMLDHPCCPLNQPGWHHHSQALVHHVLGCRHCPLVKRVDWSRRRRHLACCPVLLLLARPYCQWDWQVPLHNWQSYPPLSGEPPPRRGLLGCHRARLDWQVLVTYLPAREMQWIVDWEALRHRYQTAHISTMATVRQSELQQKTHMHAR